MGAERHSSIEINQPGTAAANPSCKRDAYLLGFLGYAVNPVLGKTVLDHKGDVA